MKLSGAELVCESLIKEGVDILFGLPGGAVLPLYGALPEYPRLRHILLRSFQRQGGSVPRRRYRVNSPSALTT